MVAMKVVGISAVHFHDLRNIFGSKLNVAGDDLDISFHKKMNFDVLGLPDKSKRQIHIRQYERGS